MADRITVKLNGTGREERFKLKGLDIPTIESTFGVSCKEFRDSDGDVVAVGGFEPGQTYTLHPKPVPPPTRGKTIKTHGLPLLGPGQGSESKPSKNTRIEPATLEIHPFNLVTDAPILDVDNSAIWGTQHEIRHGWSSESDIQHAVRNVLSEVILSTGLQDYIKCANEFSVFDLRPDIWIVTTRSGNPLGVVEVKRPGESKPGESILEDKHVFGQIYDYMLRLHSFHGLKDVFGIVATYEEWRICWFPESQATAESSSVDADKAARERKLESEPDLDDESELEDEEDPLEMIEDKEIGTRILHGTAIIPWNDPDLVKKLHSAVLKMYESRLHYQTVSRMSIKRPYIKLTEDTWYWITLGKNDKIPKLNFRKMPKLDSDLNLLLLEDFRGGEDGRVWLACSMKGEVCVIKFAERDTKKESQQTPEQKLGMEASNWNTLGRNEVQVKKLGGCPALVMPYIRPLKQEELHEKKVAVQTAARAVVNAGLRHDDMHLRHVGVMSPRKKTEKPQVVFFDLAHMTEIVTEEDKEKAYNHMISKLSLDLKLYLHCGHKV